MRVYALNQGVGIVGASSRGAATLWLMGFIVPGLEAGYVLPLA